MTGGFAIDPAAERPSKSAGAAALSETSRTAPFAPERKHAIAVSPGLPIPRHGFWHGVDTGLASVWPGHSFSPSRRSASALTTRYFWPTWMYLTVSSRHVPDRRFRPVLARLLLRSSGRRRPPKRLGLNRLEAGQVHSRKLSAAKGKPPCAGAGPQAPRDLYAPASAVLAAGRHTTRPPLTLRSARGHARRDAARRRLLLRRPSGAFGWAPPPQRPAARVGGWGGGQGLPAVRPALRNRLGTRRSIERRHKYE